MTNKIVLLASYPKSGSTWVKFIVQGLVAPHASYEEAIPSLNKKSATTKIVEDAPVYDIAGSSTKILKTHCQPNNDRLCGIDNIATAAIVVYRHPLDVLLSAINFFNVKNQISFFKDGEPKSLERILKDGEMDYYIDAFIENDGISVFSRMCGVWSQYQKKWDDFGASRLYLRLRYEDMVESPKESILAIRDFLVRDGGAPSVEAVMSNVERLNSQVYEEFFWSKSSYNYLAQLDRPSITKFEKQYQPVLADLGYDTLS